MRVLPCQVHAAQITTAVGSTTKAAMDGDWAKQLNLSQQADYGMGYVWTVQMTVSDIASG